MEQFELTDKHIELLSRGNYKFIKTMMNNTVGLDSKRPFGNSDMVADMAGVFGIQRIAADSGDSYLPAGTTEAMRKVYETELPTAMEIVMTHQTFTPGHFYRNEPWTKWIRDVDCDQLIESECEVDANEPESLSAVPSVKPGSIVDEHLQRVFDRRVAEGWMNWVERSLSTLARDLATVPGDHGSLDDPPTRYVYPRDQRQSLDMTRANLDRLKDGFKAAKGVKP